MSAAPPILIWQPGGGTPIGPVSNPPVYSQSDVTPLVEGQAYIDVVFGSVQTNGDWVLVTCEVENTTDITPLNIWPGIITNRTTAGFRLQLNGLPDSGNYYLHWAVSGVNIAPTGATLYQLSGPTSGGLGALIYTVRLPPSTTVISPVTITPSDGGAGGSFNVASVVLTNSSASATFSYTPASGGARTISTTNSSTLIDPAGIVLTITIPTYTLTGPSSGVSGVASTNFTVTLIGALGGTLTVTPHDAGTGTAGTFTPSTVSLTTGAPSATFTYTPGSTGAKTISVTNDGGLTNPGSLTYTSTVALHLLNTLISYWKLDEASGIRNDSQGTNHLTPGGAMTAVSGKINNAAQFTASGNQALDVASNSSLQVTGDFTFSVWVKLFSQVDSGILGKSGSGFNEYFIIYDFTGGNGFYFGVGNLTAGSDIAYHPGGLFADGVWTHLVGWYDTTDHQSHLRINDAATYSSTTSPALGTSTGDFTIGKASTTYSNAIIDEVGFWKRKLTAAEITALYNAGAGLPFSSFTA